jgi:FkbM family methyltransferase
MKKKTSLKLISDKFITFFNSFSLGRRINERIIRSAFETTMEIQHADVKINFCIPNSWARVRAETFSTKEPETLDWIDDFSSGTILWDIGGNLGLYSLYTALKDKTAKVYTFEPSVFNLEIFARNIVLNGLQNQITIMPLALSESSGTDNLYMSTTSWGGAMSTFGQIYGHDGEKINEVFSYKMPSCSLDDLCDNFGIEKPNVIKMDVDGIEHLILKGGTSILRSPQLKTMLIEVNDNFVEQRDTVKYLLEEAGWKLKEKLHAEWADKNESRAESSTYNQIWSHA